MNIDIYTIANINNKSNSRRFHDGSLFFVHKQRS